MSTMLRTLALTCALGYLSGCCSFSHCLSPEQSRTARFAQLEEQVIAFSKKVNAYWADHGGMPGDFDERQFFDVLATLYPTGPDHKAVAGIKGKYRVRVHALPGESYALVLCDPASDAKILEDFSCKTTKVEIRHWDSPDPHPCEFEPDPGRFCSAGDQRLAP